MTIWDQHKNNKTILSEMEDYSKKLEEALEELKKQGIDIKDELTEEEKSKIVKGQFNLLEKVIQTVNKKRKLKINKYNFINKK